MNTLLVTRALSHAGHSTSRDDHFAEGAVKDLCPCPVVVRPRRAHPGAGFLPAHIHIMTVSQDLRTAGDP